MQLGYDINQRLANSWKKANAVKPPLRLLVSKLDVLNGVKSMILDFILCNITGKDDEKYRNIVDLIMLRIKSNLDIVELDNASFDFNDVSSAIASNLNEKRNNLKHIQLKDIVEAASKNIINAYSQLKASNIEDSSDKAQSKKSLSRRRTRRTKLDNTADLLPSGSSFDDSKLDNSTLLSQNEATLLKKALESMSLAINDEFNRLADLCEYSKNIKLKHYLKDAKTKTEKLTPISIASTQLKKLQLKTSIGLIAALQDKMATGDDSQKTSTAVIPKLIALNNIYKYNKNAFKGVSVVGITMLVLLVLHNRDFFLSIADSVSKFENMVAVKSSEALDIAKRIYDATSTSIVNFIIKLILSHIISQLLSPLKDKIVDLIKKAIPGWLKAFMEFISGFFKALKSILKLVMKVFKRAFKIAKRLVTTAFRVFKSTAGAIMRRLMDVLKVMWKAVTLALTLAAKALRLIARFAVGAMKFVQKLFSKTKIGKLFYKLGTKLKSAVGKLKTAFSKVAGKIKNVFNSMKQALKGAFNAVKNAIKNVGKKIFNTIKNVIKKIVKKIFTVVKNVVKKIVLKIMKKLGITVAKKIAKKQAKSLLMVGAKKIMEFFKKWVVKIIEKLAKKILGAAAVNLIPILGQIISIALMIYNIVDTIITFWDVYKFMKENPAAWDYMKEKIAEWADKAFNFLDDLLKFGKKVFGWMLDKLKKMAKGFAHAVNFLFSPFSSAERSLKEAEYVKELQSIKDKNFAKLDSMDPSARAKFVKSKYKLNMAEIDKNRPESIDLTEKIEKEQDSWWPDNDDILDWMAKRQKIHRHMMWCATEIGLVDFSKTSCNAAKKIVEEQERQEAERKRIAAAIAARRKEMALKYGNKRIDLEALQKICLKYKDDYSAINKDIKNLTKTVKDESLKMIDVFEDYVNEEDDDEKANDMDELDVIAV